MRTIYVDVAFGSDITGGGDSARPYKTIANAVAQSVPGDEIAINDYTSMQHNDFVFNEAGPIVLDNLLHLTIRFLKMSSAERTALVWKPLSVGTEKANLVLRNCTDVRIEGATFLSQSPLTDHRYAVRIENSQEITISDCHIHHHWEVDNSLEGELFSCVNSNVTITKCKMDLVNNSYHNKLSFIKVSGNGDYMLTSNAVTNVTGNGGSFNGVHVAPDTRKVTIDGLVIHNVTTELVDAAVGLKIESDSSQVEFLVNGAQFSNIHVGVLLSNIPGGILPRRIKHSTFYKCRVALKASHAQGDFYNCNVHGTPTITHTNPPGTNTVHTTYGIYSESLSSIKVLNSIFTNIGTIFYGTDSGAIKAEHTIWNGCTALQRQDTGGNVDTAQYIRRIDPLYEDLTASPYGSFLLTGLSAAIDAGKKYGDPFLGMAPDIGAMERSRDVRLDDLPALISRSARFTTKIPLTNIDIEGMIVRGIDSQDPEIQAGREGSAIRDIAVKPLLGLLTPYQTELESIRDSLNFSKIENMTEEDADALASNLFVTRRTGDIASGIIRIYFESARSVVIPAEAQFTDGSANIFYTRQETIISEEEMALNYENGMYYVDVLAESGAIGTEYNIAANAINRYTTPMPEGIVSVTNPYPFEGGDVSESNTQLAARIADAITVRDLVTKKGIKYVMQEQFPFIQEVMPIGFRDAEMLRDEILGYHIGGKVDIYIKTAAYIADTKIIDEVTQSIPLTLATWGNVPILYIDKIEILDPATMDSTDIFIPNNMWEVSVANPKTTFSIYEENSLLINQEYWGLPVKIYYVWIPEIRALQEWIEDSDYRVVCADLIVKHYAPALVTGTISYYAETEIEGAALLIQSEIERVKSELPLQLSDLTDILYSAGATHVVTPFTFMQSVHKTNGDIVDIESEDELWSERTERSVAYDVRVVYLGRESY